MTYIFDRFSNRDQFVDPLIWLTQNIEEIIKKRENLNVKLYSLNLIKIIFVKLIIRSYYIKLNKIARKDFIQLLMESQINNVDLNIENKHKNSKLSNQVCQLF